MQDLKQNKTNKQTKPKRRDKKLKKKIKKHINILHNFVAHRCEMNIVPWILLVG